MAKNTLSICERYSSNLLLSRRTRKDWLRNPPPYIARIDIDGADRPTGGHAWNRGFCDGRLIVFDAYNDIYLRVKRRFGFDDQREFWGARRIRMISVA